MNTLIDSRAIVHPKAQLAENVTVGPFAIIEEDVTIGPGTRIASHTLIASGARIGKECVIHHGAVVATIPQDLKFRGEQSVLEIGDHTTVREYATLNRGTGDHGKTTIGSNCFIMAYSHVAHDCTLGNNLVLANSVNMAGHVTIEDHVVIGGMVAIHQFVRVGCHAMIAGGYRVAKDVPPYVLAGKDPLVFEGLNAVGLRRRGLDPGLIRQIDDAYQLLYRSGLNISEGVRRIRAEMTLGDELRHVVEFIESSKRGVIGSRK